MTVARKPSRLVPALLGLVAALLISAPLAQAAPPAAHKANAGPTGPTAQQASGGEASVGEEIIERCTHGESVAGFTLSQYREALHIATSGPNSSELEEYSSCVAIIKHAERAAARTGQPQPTTAEEEAGTAPGGAPGGGPGSTAAPGPPEGAGAGRATPVSEGEQQQIDTAAKRGSGPIDLGGHVVHPGVVAAHAASALGSLPTPLKVVLAFIAAGALATLGYTLRHVLPGRLGFSRGGGGTGGAPDG